MDLLQIKLADFEENEKKNKFCVMMMDEMSCEEVCELDIRVSY